MTIRMGWLAAALVVSLAVGARAEIITDTFKGVTSGSLGVTGFTDAAFTITATYDSATVSSPMGNPLAPDITSTFDIAGVGSGTFSGTTYSVDLPGTVSMPGFLIIADQEFANAIMGVISHAFDSYDLKTPIGPITGAGAPNPGYYFATSLGDLGFSSVTGTATVTAAAVPEPSSLVLAGIGTVTAIGWFARRRRERVPA